MGEIEKYIEERNQAWREAQDPAWEEPDCSITRALEGVSDTFLNTLIDFSPNLCLFALYERARRYDR